MSLDYQSWLNACLSKIQNAQDTFNYHRFDLQGIRHSIAVFHEIFTFTKICDQGSIFKMLTQFPGLSSMLVNGFSAEFAGQNETDNFTSSSLLVNLDL